MPGPLLLDTEKAALKTLIEEARVLLLGPADIAPHDYHTLLDQVIKIELQEITTMLTHALERHDWAELFKEFFTKLCKARVQLRANSALGFCVMPHSPTNELCAKIALLVFKPNTLGELLQILLPEVICITFEASTRKTGSLLPEDLIIQFQKEALASLEEEPAGLENLTHFILADNLLLNARDISGFNFGLHQKYQQELQKFNPTLASQLYQKNPAIRALKNDLLLVEGAGPTPGQAISTLIKELKLGGERMTGQAYASTSAQIAFTDFKAYLISLPEAMRATLLALSTAGKTMASIMKHLDAEKCVEIAANNLQTILDNKNHSSYLNTPLTLTKSAIARLKEKYGAPKVLATADNDGIKPLPKRYLDLVLTKIQLNNAYDCISILLSFPPELYLPLFQKVILVNADAWIKDVLTMIKEIANQEQYLKFISALFITRDRFGGLDLLYTCAITYNHILLWAGIIQSLPDTDRLNNLIQFKQKSNSLLHLTVLKHPEIFKGLLELLPKTSRLVALQEVNGDKDTVLHLAINKPESFRAILALLPKTHLLAALQVKDKNCNTLLHLAVNKPEYFRIILELLPEDHRLTAAQITDQSGNTMLHLAINNPESLQAILDLLPPNTLFAGLQIADGKGNTLLHLASNNPVALSAILKSSPRCDLFALQVANQDGDTLLHLAAEHPASLKVLLALLPKESLLAGMQVAHRKGDTVQYLANKHPESLKAILASLPEEDRLTALEATDEKYNTVLSLAASNPSLKEDLESLPKSDSLLHSTVLHNPLLFKCILELLPESKRFAAVLEVNKDENTVLHLAINNPISLRAILELLPRTHLLAAIQVKDNHCNTVLHLALNNPLSFQAILELVPEPDLFSGMQLADSTGNTVLHLAIKHPAFLNPIFKSLPGYVLVALQLTNQNGHTVLHRAANNPDSLKTILALLPETSRLMALRSTDNDGNTPLHLATNCPAALKVILELLPEKDRLTGILARNLDQHTVLHYAAYTETDNPVFLMTILELLSEKDRLASILVGDQDQDTALHLSAYHPNTLKAILALLPIENRLTSIRATNENHHTVLHLAADYPASLKAILELLPETDRLVADESGNTVLHLAAEHPASLKVILELLPETDRLAAIEVTDENDNTVLHLAANNPASLEAILESLPEEDRYIADDYGNTVLHFAANNPASLKVILELLPEEDRLMGMESKDEDDNTVFHLAANNPESLKTIIALLPATEDYLAVFLEPNGNWDTVLHLAADNPVSLKTILELFEETELFDNIQLKNDAKETVLDCAVKNPASLKVILELLPVSDHIAVTQITNENNETLIYETIQNSESLKLILNLYPNDAARLDAVKARNTDDGDTALHHAAFNKSLESFKIILSLYPDEAARLAAVQVSNDAGITVLQFAAQGPEMLKLSLSLYPEAERLAALQQNTSDFGTALYRAKNNVETLKVVLSLLPKEACSALIKTEDLSLFAKLSPDELMSHYPKDATNPALRIVLEERLEALLIEHGRENLNAWQCLLCIILPKENNAHYDARTGTIHLHKPSEAPIQISLAHLLLDSYLIEGQTNDHKRLIKILLAEHKRKSSPSEEWLALAIIAKREGMHEEEKSCIRNFITSGQSSHSPHFFDTSRTRSISEAIWQEFLSKGPEAEAFYQHHKAAIHNVLNLPRPGKLQKLSNDPAFT